jgi:hypothetical protein
VCERNDKAYYKTNTRIIIENPHSLQWMILLSILFQHTWIIKISNKEISYLMCISFKVDKIMMIIIIKKHVHTK